MRWRPAPNSLASGALTISGTARAGETLTADTSGIADADGLDDETFAYRWLSNNGNSDTEIAGATGLTYTLADDHEGNTIKDDGVLYGRRGQRRDADQRSDR